MENGTSLFGIKVIEKLHECRILGTAYTTALKQACNDLESFGYQVVSSFFVNLETICLSRLILVATGCASSTTLQNGKSEVIVWPGPSRCSIATRKNMPVDTG